MQQAARAACPGASETENRKPWTASLGPQATPSLKKTVHGVNLILPGSAPDQPVRGYGILSLYGSTF